MTATLKQANPAFQAGLYDSGNPTRRWLHNQRREWVMCAFHKHRPQHTNARFLEVGIGCASYTRQLRAYGTVVAADVNPEFVALANKIPNVQPILADITDTRFIDANQLAGTIDVAICSEVLEHVSDSYTALCNLYAALKPEGILILTTPNAYSTLELAARMLKLPFASRIISNIYGEPVDALGHINLMTRKTLYRQISAVGFMSTASEDLGFYLPFFAEFGGKKGQTFCESIWKTLSRSRFNWLCWTQCWILRKHLPPFLHSEVESQQDPIATHDLMVVETEQFA